jgi:hypothetical protein
VLVEGGVDEGDAVGSGVAVGPGVAVGVGCVGVGVGVEVGVLVGVGFGVGVGVLNTGITPLATAAPATPPSRTIARIANAHITFLQRLRGGLGTSASDSGDGL